MRIGIDIDDTLFDTDEVLIKHALEYDKNYFEGRGYQNEYAYELKEKFYWNDEQKEKFLNYVFSSLLIFEVPAKKETSYITNKLHEDGNEVIIITYRHNRDNIDVQGLTEDMLRRNNIYFDKLITGALKKGKVCINEKIDIFIDDSLKQCEDVVNSGIKNVIMYETKYNKDKDIFKMNNWNDIYDYIRRLSDERKNS